MQLRDVMTPAMQEIERSLEEVLCFRVMSELSCQHRVVTFMTANHNRIMRIQPPLVIQKPQIDRFLTAFREVCDKLSGVAAG